MVQSDPYSVFRYQNLGAGTSFSSPYPDLAGSYPQFAGFEQYTPSTGSLNMAFADFLEEEPDIPYFGALQRQNLTPNQADFFRTQRNSIFNQYLGLGVTRRALTQQLGRSVPRWAVTHKQKRIGLRNG